MTSEDTVTDPQILFARVEALEELLAVQEQVVQEQSDCLETAMAEVQTYALKLEDQQAELEMQQTELLAANAQLTDANQRLAALASTDGLTGLKNHRTFQERLAEEMTRSQRYSIPLSLLLLDVDRFKQYNDSFGHPAGDAVLQRVARILQANARSMDVVARYGGEEFAVLLPETERDGAKAVAERMRAAIEQGPWKERTVTASLGVAHMSSDVDDAAMLLARADEALYRSKQAGRNRVTCFGEWTTDSGSLLTDYNELTQAILHEHTETPTPARELLKEALRQGYDSAIEGWARVLDMRDQETEGHSLRVTEMTVMVARHFGLSEEEILYARWGALLHDIGKMGISDQILLKPEPLTEAEWEIMHRHPTIAYEMLSPIAFLKPALDIPYCHHEKWDGTGYPRGLKGEEIPFVARLFAVIDVWDALRSHRPYRKKWSAQQAISHLQSQAGTHFDPQAVRVFLKTLRECKTPYADPGVVRRSPVMSAPASLRLDTKQSRLTNKG
jgi:diguanylate cyclase (GGDEF)-like protein/putative nucleotidyltransferase with HDIG domain